MEYKCVEAVFPEMNAAALFQLSVTPMGARFYTLPQSCEIGTETDVLHGDRPSANTCTAERTRSDM